jgi:hypothetical protein
MKYMFEKLKNNPMKKSILLLPVFVLVLFLFHSCQKELGGDNLTTAKESAIANLMFDDVFRQVDYAGRYMDNTYNVGKSLHTALNGCGTITINPAGTTFPKTITIDFGTSNCQGVDLRQRRGVITATIDGWYGAEGTTVVISTTNYYVNDYKVEGTKTIENLGRNLSNNLEFEVNVTSGKVTSPEDDVFTWTSQRTNEWIEGEGTPLDPLDDVYLVSGSAEGETSQGRNYSLNITTPLNILIGCRWIRAGVLEVTQDPGTDFTIDYGDGTCDSKAVATILGIDFRIDLP